MQDWASCGDEAVKTSHRSEELESWTDEDVTQNMSGMDGRVEWTRALVTLWRCGKGARYRRVPSGEV